MRTLSTAGPALALTMLLASATVHPAMAVSQFAPAVPEPSPFAALGAGIAVLGVLLYVRARGASRRSANKQ